MDMQVVRLHNPHALAELEVMRLLAKWAPEPHRWLSLAQQLERGDAALWGASTRPEKLEGMFIVQWPLDALQDMPQVAFFYCEGGVKLRRKMIQEMVAAIRAAGYTSFAAINDSGASDDVWCRTFRECGPVKRIATLFEFNVETEEEANVRHNQEAIWGLKAREPTDKRKRTGGHHAGRAEGNPRPVRRKPEQRAAGRRKASVARPVRGRDNARRGKGPRGH